MTNRIPEASLRAPSAWALPMALVIVSGLLEAGGASVNEALRYDRAAVADGQWWRLLTANLVHLSAWHWLLNASSLVLLVLLCPERPRPVEGLVRVLLIGVGITVWLHVFVAGVVGYVGLSGLVYGLFVLGFGRQIAAGDRFAIVCLGFVVIRIAWECRYGVPDAEVRLIGGQVIAESHLAGAAAATLYGLATGAFRPPSKAPAAGTRH